MSVAAAGALLVPHGAAQILSGSWAGSLLRPRRVPRDAVGRRGINTAAIVLIAAVHSSPAFVFPSEHVYVVAFAVPACVTAGAVACAPAMPRLPRSDRDEPDVQAGVP
jgi:hypothetical protein